MSAGVSLFVGGMSAGVYLFMGRASAGVSLFVDGVSAGVSLFWGGVSAGVYLDRVLLQDADQRAGGQLCMQSGVACLPQLCSQGARGIRFCVGLQSVVYAVTGCSLWCMQ